jgi:hypothetical protein
VLIRIKFNILQNNKNKKNKKKKEKKKKKNKKNNNKKKIKRSRSRGLRYLLRGQLYFLLGASI